MAPINLPDGTEVSEVILPDGASASEVVAPDGSTVFIAIPDGAIEDFESGDVSGWTQSESAEFNAVQTTDQGASAFEGSYCAECHVDSATNIQNTLSISTITPNDVRVAIRNEQVTTGLFERTYCRFKSGSSIICSVMLSDSDSDILVQESDGNTASGTSTGKSYSEDTWYDVVFRDLDFSNDVIGAIEIDGTEVLTDVAFVDSASQMDEIEHSAKAGGTTYGYSDFFARD